MKTDPFSWLYLEPFVHLTIRGDQILLYNTLNHKMLLVKGKPAITGLCRSLLKPGNGSVIKIETAELSKREISSFISDLQKNFMGDLLRPSWSEKKPVMISPKPLIKKDKTGYPRPASDLLRDITIHLSSGNSGVIRQYNLAFRQFTFPLFMNGKKKELDPGILRSILSETRSYPRLSLNFVTEDLLQYSHAGDLLSQIEHSGHRIRFYTFPVSLNSGIFKNLPKEAGFTFLLTYPFDTEKINRVWEEVKDTKNRIKLEWHFIVQDSHELTEANRLIHLLNLRNSFFKPYFNRLNNDFFRDYIFITEEDLHSSHPDQQQIFARKMINETDWGKVILIPGGKLYANINDQPLGNLKQNSLEYLANMELEKGTSWKRIRPGVTPCKKCLFELLCPPVSNYELVMRKFNLCHLFH
ncbi:MAG: TIGR04150 pseudo-rSAM protein [bacterium]